VIVPRQHVILPGQAMKQHDNPVNALDQMDTAPSASARLDGPVGGKPTSEHRAANISAYAEAAPAGAGCRVDNARTRGTVCYVATAPVNYFATGNQSDFLLHHRHQSLALSFLGACAVSLMIALLIPTVWLLLAWDQAELALVSSQVIAIVFLLVVAALTISGLAGMVTAARGSMRPLPVLARLGRMPWVRRGAMIGESLILAALTLVAALGIYANKVARLPDGKPAALYIVYDDRYAPRWAMALASAPTICAAEAYWGRGSTIVAPIIAESFAESVANGRFVYVAVHGVSGPLVYHGGEFTPRDVARTMPIGKSLQYVYLSACHSGDLAADWESVLAPAKVVTFSRVSLYLEHAVFLWYTAPRLIAGNNLS
jgi:hypothetical protein